MTNAVPERGRLTDLLVAYLRTHPDLTAFPLVIGDADPPAEAGWPGGQAQVGDFVASTTVRTLPATPLHREPVASRHSSWRCRYGLRTIGAVRHQADAGADVVRASMVALAGQGFAEFDWGIQDVVYESLGPVEKRGSGDAATWDVDDVVELWIARRRATT